MARTQPESRRRWWLAWLAPDDLLPPRPHVRACVFPLVFIPWLLLYECVVIRGPESGSFMTYLPGEWNWPIWQPMEIFYASAYVLVTLAPLLAPTNQSLRRFVIGGLLAIIAANFIFLTVPAIAPPRPFHPSGFLGQMMLIDRKMDLNNGTAAFPSFHVVWAFLAAALFGQRWPRLRWCWQAWAVLVSASCILTGMHSLADVAAGFVMFILIHQCTTRWDLRAAIRTLTVRGAVSPRI